jgi:uncharacterized protein (TIGR02246 family)
MSSRRMLILFAATYFVTMLVTTAVPSSRRSISETDASAQAIQTPTASSDAIAKVRDAWVKDLRDKQLDRISMLYAEDAAFHLPTGVRVTGRPAIHELCKNVFATMSSDITLHTVAAERSGNLAYDSGDFSEALVSVADGKKAQSQGSYLMIFRRQPNGSWLIAEQMWTGAEPDFH